MSEVPCLKTLKLNMSMNRGAVKAEPHPMINELENLLHNNARQTAFERDPKESVLLILL